MVINTPDRNFFMEEVKKTVVSPPVRIGDVIIHDIAGTGSDLVATAEMLE